MFDEVNGECRTSFAIPGAPSMVACDVTSIMCLSGGDANGGALSSAQETPLILAGAYDGRVAVSRADVESGRHSVLNAWQASGPSLMGSLHMEAPSFQRSAMSHFGFADNQQPIGTCLHTAGDMLRTSGNGLVVAFQGYNSSLYTAGCDGNILTVWDLQTERRSWSNSVVAEGAFPLALCVPPWTGGRDIAVVGASDGAIRIIDTRARKAQQSFTLGGYANHQHAVVALAHRNGIGDGCGETIVSTDCEGEIHLWDVRVSGTSLSTLTDMHSPMRPHQSDLAAMAVHPSGNYIVTGSTSKCVRLFDADALEKEHLVIRNRSSQARKGGLERITAAVSLAFHQEEYALAVGCTDSSVTLYGTGL